MLLFKIMPHPYIKAPGDVPIALWWDTLMYHAIACSFWWQLSNPTHRKCPLTVACDLSHIELQLGIYVVVYVWLMPYESSNSSISCPIKRMNLFFGNTVIWKLFKNSLNSINSILDRQRLVVVQPQPLQCWSDMHLPYQELVL